MELEPGADTITVVLVALTFCTTVYVPFPLHVTVGLPVKNNEQKSPHPYRALKVYLKSSLLELVAPLLHTTR
jgi:hypothetical protein